MRSKAQLVAGVDGKWPMAVIGMLFVTHLWLGFYHNADEWPCLDLFLIFVQGFFLLNNAGKSLGPDGLISRAPFALFAGDGLVPRLYRRLPGSDVRS